MTHSPLICLPNTNSVIFPSLGTWSSWDDLDSNPFLLRLLYRLARWIWKTKLSSSCHVISHQNLIIKFIFEFIIYCPHKCFHLPSFSSTDLIPSQGPALDWLAYLPFSWLCICSYYPTLWEHPLPNISPLKPFQASPPTQLWPLSELCSLIRQVCPY